MSTFWRRVLLVLGLLGLGGGCNPLLLPLFLTSKEPKQPAEYHKLATTDKKKDVKVVILTWTGLEVRPELLQADREIAHQLAVELVKRTTENEEKLTVVNPLKVEEYKNKHPDWHSTHLDLESIGKHFKADWVIYVEVGSLSMYQSLTAGTFYRGEADVTVSLFNVNKPDDFTLPPRQIPFTYPPENQGGNRLVDSDTPPQAFRREFLGALSRRLSWLFTDRPTQDTYMGK